jgi:hypothetical protein
LSESSANAWFVGPKPASSAIAVVIEAALKILRKAVAFMVVMRL